MRFFLAVVFTCIIGKQFSFAQEKNLIDYVNPFIGTGGHGHTFPGAIVPFGMMQLSPDTRLEGWDGCSGYHFDDDTIFGFSHTHLSGTGCSDYGDILLMPINRFAAPLQYNYASAFDKQNEEASPGFYSVYLKKPKVQASLTATARCGMHQYQFQKKDSQMVVLDLVHRDEVLDSELEIEYPNKIKGYRFSKAWAKNQKVYFEIEFNKPFTDIAFYENGVFTKKPYLKGKNIKAVFFFDNASEIVKAKVAISGVDEKGAQKNLEKEMNSFDFEKYKSLAEKEWNKELQRIQFVDAKASSREKTIFYSALYHCFTQPNIYNDVDGRYRGRNDKIYNTQGKFTYYTVFSIWDTYRAWHPLMTILDSNRVNDMILTFLEQYKQTNLLPIWELSSNETDCMIGYHAASVIWDAYSKGIKKYNAAEALQACVDMANRNIASINSYKTNKYIRTDDDAEAVSKTLEYAYDDWCIAQLANALSVEKKTEADSLLKLLPAGFNPTASSGVDSNGNFAIPSPNESIYTRMDLKKSIAEEYRQLSEDFFERSKNWQNILDPETKFMRAIQNGIWYNPFSPYTVDNNYTEANSWQYSFYVPHAIEEFTKAVGGKQKFTQKLDDLFSAKNKTEGREQADITGLIGQYAHGNEPSHHIAYLYNYSSTPEKSALLIDTILKNLYSTEPDGYCGNEDCGQMSAWYVMSAMGLYAVAPGSKHYEFDEKKFKRFSIKNAATEITKENVFEKLHPNTNKVELYENKITSFLPNPAISGATQIFKDSQLVTINCLDKDAKIFYTINKETMRMYVAPFVLKENAIIEFYSAKENKRSSNQIAKFNILPNDVKVKLNCVYNKSYHAGGPEGLVDGLRGDENWKKGYWQGYQSQDFDAELLYDTAKKISSLQVSFLQDQGSWIFFPTEVKFIGITNTNQEIVLSTIPIDVQRDDDKNSLKTIQYQLTDDQKKATYKSIKTIAKNYGILPTWHKGAGFDAFIFVDEITCK
jgi:putative alpha-1,2-mannosidase